MKGCSIAMLLAAVVAANLAACAGGGGGGGGTDAPTLIPPPAPIPPAPPPPAPSLGLLAPVQTASPASPVTGGGMTVFPLLMTVVSADFAGDQATTEQGATLSVDSVTGRSALTINNAALGVSNVQGNASASNRPPVPNGTLGVYEGPGALAYTRYGAWAIWAPNTAFRNGASWLSGLPSPAAQLPLSGSAAYSGTAEGWVSEYHLCTCASAGVFRGDVQVSADFATRAVSGSMTKLDVGTDLFITGPIALNDIGFAATLDPAQNRFTGTTRVTSNPHGTHALSQNATGTITGQFFGPSAQEVGAVFTLSDGVGRVIGSFGASK
jgi:hypothetical protein